MGYRHAVIIEKSGYTEFTLTDLRSKRVTITGSEPWEGPTHYSVLGSLANELFPDHTRLHPDFDDCPDPGLERVVGRLAAERRILIVCEAWHVSTVEIHGDGYIKTFSAEPATYEVSTGELIRPKRWIGKITPTQDDGWYDAENGYETQADMLFATRNDYPGMDAGEGKSPDSNDGEDR